MMFGPRSCDQQENQQNNDPLLGGRKDEKTEEAFHRLA
jgi:hypothetical protein